ncbi:MAG: hypothetical protein KF901_22165 [Myxococcales bacterium]|nr:hypothetical protein [Myxococcales bacterium]
MRWRWVALMVVLGSGLMGGMPTRADNPPGRRPSSPTPATAADADPLFDPVSEHGQRATGMYLPGAYFLNRSVAQVVELARQTHTDALVIDLKDGAGRVTYDTQIPELRDSRRLFIPDAPGLVRGLKEAGIYTIARITCFADPQLPARHPERAIMHYRRNQPWVSWGTGGTWLDPYNRENHTMIVALAREAEAIGFDEIQLDYVRFPVDDGTQYARYPSEDGTPRPQLMIELLRRIDLAVRIPLGVDVFGLAAYREGDPSGLGQDLAAWTDYVEVYSPMLYINAMREWEVDRPERSRFLVETGIARMRERLGPRPVIRPFLQAFERGAGHEGFNPTFIARQIQGARAGGADGFLMWHPGARYSMFRRAMNGPARGLSPFPIADDRLALRRTRPSATGSVARGPRPSGREAEAVR